MKETGTVNNVYKDGNYSKTKTVKIASRRNGNASKYKLKKVKRGSSLRGKRLVFVGSSLTKGSGSGGVSFPDYIARRTGCSVVKDAIGGTTTSKGRDGKDLLPDLLDSLIKWTDQKLSSASYLQMMQPREEL